MAKQRKQKNTLKLDQGILENQKRFKNFVDAFPMGIHMYELNSEGRLIFKGANPAANNILGVNHGHFIGKSIEEAFPSLIETEVPEQYRKVAKTGKSWKSDQVTYQDEQISGTFEVFAFQTKPRAMLALFTDITDRKKTEDALLLTQFSVEHMSDGAFWMDRDANFLYVNKAACDSLGYSKEELLYMTVHDIDPNFPKNVWPSHWKEVKRRGSFTMESMHQTKQGRIFPVEITVNYLKFGGGEYNYVFARDISARKQAEQALKTSEERYRQLVENSNDAIYILFNRKFELINNRFKELLKVTAEEVKSPEFDFLELVAPKSRAFVEERSQRRSKGEKLDSQFFFTALSKDGREIEVEASVSLVKYKGGIATQGILRDLTERRNFEKRLRQAQKLEALGTLAGGIAHDFNNILMGIQGRTSLLLAQDKMPNECIDHLRGIEQYVKSAADLTKQLLGMARGGKFEVRPVDLNEIIHDSAAMFGRTKKEIKIHEAYQSDLWTVEVDTGQIEQVFLNLFVNAWQAMPQGGKIFIQTRNINLDLDFTRPYQAKPGRYVNISIADTGIGISDELKERIFDPFFTTKKMGRGTGLGLANVYGVLKNHGGFIGVESELNKGTRFNIYLPASEKKALKKNQKQKFFQKGSGTILLVDDEDIIIQVTTPILKKLGYQVLVARSGEETISKYKRYQDKIILVILDMIMPDLSGSETFDKLKSINPRIKVLLSSGYSLDNGAARLLEKGCSGFIQKPYNVEQLSQKIEESLKSK